MSLSILNQAFSDPKLLIRRDILEDTLEECLEKLVSNERENWSVQRATPWVHVRHREDSLPDQGWKLHISATAVTGRAVLSACLPIILKARTAFKFALNTMILGQLNGPHASRASSGKFITVYPADVESFRNLAAECDKATSRFDGPAILSDKRFSPRSSVYYRYGAFKPELIYDVNGLKTYALKNKDGNAVPDVRSVASRQADWVIDPFGTTDLAALSAPRPDRVLLHDRYTVTHAIRHANKGGVYLADDQLSGTKVVIKESRPHVATDRLGRDATDRLTKEAENLSGMYSLGATPKVIEVFSAQEHLFLVIERVPGISLREFVSAHCRSALAPLPSRKLLSMCIKIARLLERCHRGGFIIRDFTPNNIMVLPTGRLMLIDLEMACQVGDQKPIGIGDGTPSYTSPEQLASKHPVLADDYFSLGGIIFFLATLRDPFFPQDDPAIRPNQERMQKYYSLFAREWDLPQCLETAIRLSRASSPTDRLSASDVRQLLRKEGWNLRNRHTPMVGSLIAMPALSEAAFANAQDRASSAVSYIADSFNFASSERPMPSTCLGDSSHACNIQHGAAGVGLALLAHFKINSNKRHEKSLLELARWIRRYIRQNPEGPSGLYFGTAGVAWFLLSVADLLEEGELKEASVNLARKLPKESDLSDVTHGGAGIGLALLHFFHQTGDPQFIVEACQLGDYLRSTFGSDSPSGLLWSRTKIQPSGLDLKEVSYGFAHGGAGIGYFFLCLHLSVVGVPFATPATSDASSYRTAYLDIAMQTASNLLASSVERDSALYWPHGPSRQTLWPHWCNGSSGVGSFLIRLAAAVGDTQMEHEAIRASHAVLRERWASAAGQCHGLAGNAEFLLDLYQFTGQERFLQEAFYLGDLIELHKIIRPSGTTYPDDTGMATGLDYSIGSAGVATFFSRLAGRQERLLMLDYLLPSSTRGIKTTAGAEAHATVVSK